MSSIWDNSLDTVIVFAPLLFILIYTFITPWWKNIVSRAVCGLMFSISLVPMAKIVALIGDIPTKGSHAVTYAWLEVGFKIPVVIGVGACIFVLLRLQQLKNKGELEGKKS